MNMHDPMGLFAWVPVAGAAIGAGSNAYDNWNDWRSGKMSTGNYAKSVGLGAATGAVSTMGGPIGSLIVGPGAAAINEAGSQYIKNGKVTDTGKVVAAGASGLMGSGAGKVVGKAGKSIGRITPPKTLPIKPIKDAGKLGAVVDSSTTTEVTDSWLQKALEHKRTGK
ncbi:hypothetical protein [Desulfovibrio sp. Huiquan2017]|uniref:hypothetical protein n=1 Tax=Desulfovibrio sp. Huiquan2017 TaxID=2816861 RepID=UPI00257051A3|nr:hypothetical protein [Desulfovibrio sp. Huiquan2017]